MSTQDKKSQFVQPQKSRLPLILVLVALIAAGAVAAWALLPGASSGHKMVQAENGLVKIPQADISGGEAKFYTFKTTQGVVDFFLVKSRDGVIRAAFDTCDVCYKEKKGYRQEGDMMVCNNCDQAFGTHLINVVKGGCNPAPLARELQGDQVLIQTAALEQGSWYFN